MGIIIITNILKIQLDQSKRFIESWVTPIWKD